MIGSQREATKALRTLDELQNGLLARYLANPVWQIGDVQDVPPPETQLVVLSNYMLQHVADYRAALRNWFQPVSVGGHLIIIVPHAFLYERQASLPSRWDAAQRRLYTPRSLMDEVEEALAPNSYRVRHLGDDDTGYDYASGMESKPVGCSDLVLVLEKITVPAWTLITSQVPRRGADAPDYDFELERTRIEIVAPRPLKRILITKLDHLGDFIMGLSALEKARKVFADAEITLVVGSWNMEMARDALVADHVLAFDAFPRNSSEEEVDVHARAAQFAAAVPGIFDLAVDLRVDHDTRSLLTKVKAGLRAGIGTRAQFPFLDIFLPIDFSRNEPETAREDEIDHHAFASQAAALRGPFQTRVIAETVLRDTAIIWGPYKRLRPGRYFFEPYLELASDTGGGALILDVALNQQPVTAMTIPTEGRPRLHFMVDKPGSSFEFRIWPIANEPAVDFGFFGGRLVRQGADSVLHQAEYMRLLIELVAMRFYEGEILEDVPIG